MRLPRRIRKNWKYWARPWIPPALVDLYQRGTRHPAAIARQNALFTLPVRTLTELLPGKDAQTVDIPISQIGQNDQMIVPAAELLALAAVCRCAGPRRLFEIGTYTGVSTLIMAMNTPDEAEIFTLDVDPASRDTHRTGLGVGVFPSFTVGAAYQGTPAAAKIRQLLGNSLLFDYSPFNRSMDIVFVDADHTYDYVRTDSVTAFQLLRPGGIIIWDDYVWDARFPECAGVTRCVNELAEVVPIFRLAGTRFAIHVDVSLDGLNP